MATTTFSGPVRSESTIKTVSKNSSTGAITEVITLGDGPVALGDENNYKQLIDWTRIAQLGFVSENAKEVTEENYKKIITERSTIIHDELNSIKEGEAALFIISSEIGRASCRERV